MKSRLEGKVIVITGASSGFGARRADLLEDLARECNSATAVATDVNKREDVQRPAQAAVRQFGRIDVWINNAGVGALGRFERIPVDHAANYTGHEIRAPKPLHDPHDVVETLVRLATNPKDDEIVGADGVVKILMKKLIPGAEEKMAAKSMHKTQMEKPPRSPNALHAPISAGTEVSAGRRS